MVSIIDKQDNFLGLRGDTPNEEENILYTEVVYIDSFIKPKFNGEIFIESATDEEKEAHRIASVPQEITPRQFKFALFTLNSISPQNILEFINALPEPDKTYAYINWVDANTFKRSNEMINAFAPALGLTQLQLDDIFTLGYTIE